MTQFGHITLGIVPIMPPQPLATQRSFKVRGWVAVRLCATKQKGADISFRQTLQMRFCQVNSEKFVTACFDVDTTFIAYIGGL